MAKSTLHCSFCGRQRDEVKILIAGQEGHICEACVDHAKEIVQQEVASKQEGPSGYKLTVRKPKELKAHLDEYVIGQDEAKKNLIRWCLQPLQAVEPGQEPEGKRKSK